MAACPPSLVNSCLSWALPPSSEPIPLAAAPQAAKVNATPGHPAAEHAPLQPPGQAERPAQPAAEAAARPGPVGQQPRAVVAPRGQGVGRAGAAAASAPAAGPAPTSAGRRTAG